MKLKTLLLLLICGLLLTAISVYAIPDASTVTDVRYTVHNLSNNDNLATGLTVDPNFIGGGRNYAAKTTGGANQVCIFCHTPHNASPSVPLWNKVYTAGIQSSYKLYTSSPTLSQTAKNASITANSVSLLCLSCHDGKTAINVLHNSGYRDSSVAVTGDAVIDFGGGITAGPYPIGQSFIANGANPANLGAIRNGPNGTISTIGDSLNGTNLTDDHPIGFSYASAVADKPGTLLPTPATGIRLFNGRVECSSCHNPHIYYGAGLNGSTRIDFGTDYGWPVDPKQRALTPFLTISNQGSKLCLGCHIK